MAKHPVPKLLDRRKCGCFAPRTLLVTVRWRNVSEPEGYGEEIGGREMAGGAKRRAKELRGQAELVWARVQRSVPRSGAPEISIDGFMEAAERMPNETYTTGIAASLVASAWLYAAGRRSASLYVGVIPSLVFGLGLYARYLRRSSRRS